MRRRLFLRAAAGSLAAASIARLPRPSLASDVVEVRLRSVKLTGRAARYGNFAYNGTIPGPLLRVSYGQRVRVRYVSGVDVPTSIHWHGMLLPNAMDGVAGVTQPPVAPGEEFTYEFAPGPPGTRWYHDHAFGFAAVRGLFGLFIVDDPKEEPLEREFALVFHDVPRWSSLEAAQRGLSNAAMTDPTIGGGSMQAMPGMQSPELMGDEVAYVAHCINGATYPSGKRLEVRAGDRVRLRILNASPTQTRYVRLAGHELLVTHADGNPLSQAPTVDVLRVAAGERYDAIFEVRKPGAFLLSGISSDPLERQQAVVFCTPGMEHAAPLAVPHSLEGLRVFDYVLAGGAGVQAKTPAGAATAFEFTLGGGGWGNPRWTIDGKTWPQTPKFRVSPGQALTVRFRNTSTMEHPMHLHGHIFSLTEVDGTSLLRPLLKDGALVSANGGTATWSFTADAGPGRWLLHCHNDVHMVGGMMTELVYA